MALTTKFVKNTNFNIPTQSYAGNGALSGFITPGYVSLWTYLSSSTFASSIVLYTVPSGRTAKLTINPMISLGTTPGVSWNESASIYFSMSSFGTSNSKYMSQAHTHNVWNYVSTLLYINNALIFSTSTVMQTTPLSLAWYYSSGTGISNWVSSVASATINNSSVISPSIFNRSQGMMEHYLGASQSIAIHYGGILYDQISVSVSYYTPLASSASFYHLWSYSLQFNDVHTSILSFITIEESAL